MFVHYQVSLWVPEIGGAIDPNSEAHDLLMTLFGGMSKAERNRIKTRVRAAIASHAAIEGRFLGGRPPYGYVLGDAGDHPNPEKARVGQRLHRLEPDPVTAPVVRRIFEDFVAGAGYASLARQLTGRGIPAPSANDPARNRHRASSGGSWAKSAIKAILQNPRYVGHEVWAKQRRDEVLLDEHNVALGLTSKLRWNDRADWIHSLEPTHTPLVSTELFDQAQQIIGSATRPSTGNRRTPNSYLLKGMVRCSVCGRKMQGNQLRGNLHYRCVLKRDYPAPNTPVASASAKNTSCPSSATGSASSSTPTTSKGRV